MREVVLDRMGGQLLAQDRDVFGLAREHADVAGVTLVAGTAIGECDQRDAFRPLSRLRETVRDRETLHHVARFNAPISAACEGDKSLTVDFTLPGRNRKSAV